MNEYENIQILKEAIRKTIQPKASVCTGCRLRSVCSPMENTP